MKKMITSMIVATFAIASVAMAAESGQVPAQTSQKSTVVVHKFKKKTRTKKHMKKSKKAAKEPAAGADAGAGTGAGAGGEPAAAPAPAAPAGGAQQ